MYFYLKTKNKSVSPIRLEYYCKADKSIFKFSTGQKINPKDWDFDARMPKVLKGRSDLRAIKVKLDKHSTLLNTILSDATINDTPITSYFLKEAFNKEFRGKAISTLLYDSVGRFIDQKDQSGAMSKSWWQKYTHLQSLLKEFRPTLRVDQMSEAIFMEYAGYLRRTRNYTDNTLARQLTFFKTYLYWAKKNEGLTIEIDFAIPKYQSDQIAFNDAEVELLENYKGSERLERVRDIALVGIYSGQRYSDFSVFEKADVVGDMIIKKAEKTEYESFIPLHPKLKAVLDKYDWKLPKISNQKFNNYFKELCKRAGIDREFKRITYRGSKKEVEYFKAWEVVGSHTARRTFITRASEKGVPDEVIMKITGIKDIKTLYKYKKVTIHSVMDATKDLF